MLVGGWNSSQGERGSRGRHQRGLWVMMRPHTHHCDRQPVHRNNTGGIYIPVGSTWTCLWHPSRVVHQSHSSSSPWQRINVSMATCQQCNKNNRITAFDLIPVSLVCKLLNILKHNMRGWCYAWTVVWLL